MSISSQGLNYRSEHRVHLDDALHKPVEVGAPLGFVFNRAVLTPSGDAAGMGVGQFLPVQLKAQGLLDAGALRQQGLVHLFGFGVVDVHLHTQAVIAVAGGRVQAKACAANDFWLEPTGGIDLQNFEEILSIALDAGVTKIIPHIYSSIIDKASGNTRPEDVATLLAMVKAKLG